MVEAEHLGGYIRGGDPATYYPELWAWLVSELGAKTVLDVGCGEGHSVDFFLSLGCDVLGIDGVRQVNKRVVAHDYTKSRYMPKARGKRAGSAAFDLAWSCEFVEHVEERYLPNFVATFRTAKVLAMTHAAPGQPGYHHVNCRSADYWIGVMAGAGFALDEKMTVTARRVAGANAHPSNHFLRSGLVFRQ